MNKRGIALIMTFFVILVISILLASFFSNVVNENRLVNRHLNSIRALWLAETGIAEAINHLPSQAPPGSLGGGNYTTQTTLQPSGEHYEIQSTGSAGNISRSLRAIAKINPVDRDHFQHAIRTTADLVVKGSVEINGPSEEFASLNFADLFEHSKDDVRSDATHLYTNPPVNVIPVEGITWVDLVPPEPGQDPPEFKISSDTWKGGCGPDSDCDQTADNGAILIVAGDAQITGGTFYGIIYVIGKLRMSGNPEIYGAILAESQAEIDTLLTGNVTITYDPAAISGALKNLDYISAVIVSWEETEP